MKKSYQTKTIFTKPKQGLPNQNNIYQTKARIIKSNQYLLNQSNEHQKFKYLRIQISNASYLL